MAQSILGTVKGVFIDTETGGLDPKVHGITEVAALGFEIDLLVPGKQKAVARVTRRMQTFVKPNPWLSYCPGALGLQSHAGRTTTLEFLEAHGREEHVVIGMLAEFLGNNIYPDPKLWNSQVWAQNADFDHGFLSAMHQRVLASCPEDRTPPPHDMFAKRCDWSCSRKFFTKLGAMIYKNNCQYGKISQKDIMPFYGLDGQQAHTALQDCYDGVACLAKMFEDEASYYAQLLGVLPK